MNRAFLLSGFKLRKELLRGECARARTGLGTGRGNERRADQDNIGRHGRERNEVRSGSIGRSVRRSDT